MFTEHSKAQSAICHCVYAAFSASELQYSGATECSAAFRKGRERKEVSLEKAQLDSVLTIGRQNLTVKYCAQGWELFES